MCVYVCVCVCVCVCVSVCVGVGKCRNACVYVWLCVSNYECGYLLAQGIFPGMSRLKWAETWLPMVLRMAHMFMYKTFIFVCFSIYSFVSLCLSVCGCETVFVSVCACVCMCV